jgi:hypothetical protein
MQRAKGTRGKKYGVFFKKEKIGEVHNSFENAI